MVRWPLDFADRWLASYDAARDLPRSLDALLGVSRWIVVAAALAAVAALLVSFRRSAGISAAWPWSLTGLALGALGVLAWVTGALSEWNWGLSVTGPARSLVDVALLGHPESANWGTGMLVGIPAGTWLSARARGRVPWRMPSADELPRRLGGGLLMGMGGTLAAGCNIGNALTGLSILALNSLIATAAIFVGGALAIWIGTSTGSRTSGIALRIRSSAARAERNPCVLITPR